MWSTPTDHWRGLAHHGGCAPRGCARAPAWELSVARYLSDLGTAWSIGNGTQLWPAQGGRRAGASRPRADGRQRRRFRFTPARRDARRDGRGREHGQPPRPRHLPGHGTRWSPPPEMTPLTRQTNPGEAYEPNLQVDE